MRKKQIKRKYTKENPIPTEEKLNLLLSDYDGLYTRNQELLRNLSNKEKQIQYLSDTVDRLYEETATLRERNLTLIEAIEILARTSRVEKQQRDLNRFNRSRNDTVALANDCEAGYAHGYEKGR